MNHIENLESRLFFSANPAASAPATFHSDETTLKAEITVLKKNLLADLKVIKAEIKTLGLSKTQGHALTTTMQDANGVAQLLRDAGAQANKLNRDVNRSVADLKQWYKKPGDLGVSGNLFDDENALSADSSAAQSQLQADAQTFADKLNAQLTVLASADPSSMTLAADVNTAGTDLNNNGGSIGTAETALASTDISNLEALLAV